MGKITTSQTPKPPMSKGPLSANDIIPSTNSGLVTNAVTASALRLAPPLTVSEDELHEELADLVEVICAFADLEKVMKIKEKKYKNLPFKKLKKVLFVLLISISS